MHRPFWIMLAAPLLIAGCTRDAAPTAPDTLWPLIEAMTERLEIADEVALSKWYSGKPVEDLERERQVIANAESQAARFNLARDDVRQFMTAQIEANKLVQHVRLEQWREDGHAPHAAADSLTQGIRGRLDALQPILMQRYAAFQPRRHDAACASLMNEEIATHIKDPVHATALERATQGLCAAPLKA